MKDFGVLEFLDGLKSSGRIRCVGFSFSRRDKVFKQIIDAYDGMLRRFNTTSMTKTIKPEKKE